MTSASSPSATQTTATANNTLFLVISLLVIGSFHFIFASWLAEYMPPGTAAMYVLAVATVEVAVFALFRRRAQPQLLRHHGFFFTSIGFLVGASTFMNYFAVSLIDPGMATVLARSSILLSLAFGMIWLREKMAPIQIAGAAITVFGVFIVAFQPGDYIRLGSFIVLGGVFMYELHTASVKRFAGAIDMTTFFLYRLLFTTAFLFLFNLISALLQFQGGGLSWPSGRAWVLLILAGTIDVVLSRSLYYIALRRLNLTTHAIILTVSPLLAVIWTAIFFDITPTRQVLLGGLAILAGVFIVTANKRKSMRAARIREKQDQTI